MSTRHDQPTVILKRALTAKAAVQRLDSQERPDLVPVRRKEPLFDDFFVQVTRRVFPILPSIVFRLGRVTEREPRLELVRVFLSIIFELVEHQNVLQSMVVPKSQSRRNGIQALSGVTYGKTAVGVYHLDLRVVVLVVLQDGMDQLPVRRET
jgi:hypothetical protein